MFSGMADQNSKKTKPFWTGWQHFHRKDKTSGRAICIHCKKEVRNRSDDARKHLEKCKAYLALETGIQQSSSSSVSTAIFDSNAKRTLSKSTTNIMGYIFIFLNCTNFYHP